MKNNQQGRSMIEMLGVLAIIGLLSVSGISLYSKALHQRKINTTIEQVSQIISNMRNAYRNRNKYSFNTKDLTQTNDKRKIIPDNMWVNGKIKTALGNEVTVTSNEKTFTIQLKGLIAKNDNTCVKIVTADWGNNVWVGATAKYNSGMIGNNGHQKYAGSMSIEEAIDWCQKKSGVLKGIEFLVK